MKDFHASGLKREQRNAAAPLRKCRVVGAARCAIVTALLVSGMGCAGPWKDGFVILQKQAIAVAPLPPAIVDQVGILAFRIYLATQKRIETPAETALVERVKVKLLDAVAHSEFAATARQLNWEVVVVKGDSPDAVAFPGGKVIVQSALLQRDHTGPLKLQPEDRLAVALGHELVHPLAGHMAQRIDKELRELRQALALAMEGKDLADVHLDPATTAALMTAMGVQYEASVIRPFTGEQELEADHKGLLITARAGYDPKLAVTFWQQIQQLSNGQHPVEILSLHPSYDTRIVQLNNWMAEAHQLYQSAAATGAEARHERS